MIEKLTDDETVCLQFDGHEKARRIIDAQAAEIERLHVREEQREHAWSVDMSHRHAAEARLATAVGVIDTVKAALASEEMPGITLLLIRNAVYGWPGVHLASAQPAAPARPEAEQPVLDYDRGYADGVAWASGKVTKGTI